VNESRSWEKWSPWIKADPTVKMTYAGPSGGVDAVTQWASKKMGEGRSVVTESRPGELIRMDVEIIKPFKCLQHHEFTFKSESGNETLVTWSMRGKNNFMSKACGLFMDSEKIVGPMFEQGLTQLKSITER